MLCPFFGVHAQDKNLSVTSGSANNRGIAIGQQVPDILIRNISGLNGSDKTPAALPLSAFKGKLLILDFWATWCAPCIASFPKMKMLQQKYQKDLQVILVNNEPVARVTAFLLKRKTE